jgi:hypothetical protein
MTCMDAGEARTARAGAGGGAVRAAYGKIQERVSELGSELGLNAPGGTPLCGP